MGEITILFEIAGLINTSIKRKIEANQHFISHTAHTRARYNIMSDWTAYIVFKQINTFCVNLFKRI